MEKITLTQDFREFLRLLDSEKIEYARRELIPYEDLVLSVISYEDLRRNKIASGRGRDIADLEMLAKRRKP